MSVRVTNLVDVERIARASHAVPGGWAVPVRCHEWRGPRMGENRGYRCVECGARVERAAEMQDAPLCRERYVLNGHTWLPLKLAEALAAHLRAPTEGEG